MFSIMAILVLAGTITPVALADSTTIEQLEAKIAEIGLQYGFKPDPILTDEQWNSYDKEWDVLEQQKQPYYKQLDELDLKYDSIWAELDKIDAKGNTIGEKYGLNTYPDLTDEQWAEYYSLTDSIYDQLDPLYEEQWKQYDTDVSKIVTELGIKEPVLYDDDPQFFDEMHEHWYINVELLQIGDYTIPLDEKSVAHKKAVEILPGLQGIYEKHGYYFPDFTEQQFRELDEKLSKLNEKYDELEE